LRFFESGFTHIKPFGTTETSQQADIAYEMKKPHAEGLNAGGFSVKIYMGEFMGV
jgi:hypothetical protein